MRIMIIGILAAGLALGACSNEAPATDGKAQNAGTIEEGVGNNVTEIEELPVEEGAPVADATPTASGESDNADAAAPAVEEVK